MKESVVKASKKRLLFPEIEYSKNSDNSPKIVFHGNAEKWLNNNNFDTNPLVSISHDNDMTIAFVILQCQIDKC